MAALPFLTSCNTTSSSLTNNTCNNSFVENIFDRSDSVPDPVGPGPNAGVCSSAFRHVLVARSPVSDLKILPATIVQAAAKLASSTAVDQTDGGPCCPLLGLRRTGSGDADEDGVEPITVDGLASALVDQATGSGRAVVIVDSRAFISFNVNHIAGAYNAPCCDRFSQKRLKDGRATVADLVSGGGPSGAGCIKEAFRKAATTAGDDGEPPLFVAYDDNASDVASLPANHPLRLLTRSMVRSGYRTKYLKGGFQAFYGACAALCSKPFDQPSRPFLYSPTTPVVEQDVDSAPMAMILPFLFIGNERDAADREILRAAGITHVLNVTSCRPLFFEDDVTLTYLRVPASDSGTQNLKQFFDRAIEFIETARCSGGRVLVHCQGGVSRSPTLVIAYVMARFGRTMLDAFAFVKSCRGIIAPNFNFMGQLLDFEHRCRRDELHEVLREDPAPSPLPENVDAANCA